MKKISFFILAIISFCYVSAQMPDIFSKPELIKDFLDGKSYIVPEFGSIKFEYSKGKTQKSKDEYHDIVKFSGSDPDAIPTILVFDVSVKRNDAKRKDKNDYLIEIEIPSTEYDDIDPNSTYSKSFQIYSGKNSSSAFFPITGFPSNYHLFADGELYYGKKSYKKMPFLEYKKNILNDINHIYPKKSIDYIYTTQNFTVTYSKCIEMRK